MGFGNRTVCGYWRCNRLIDSKYFLCAEHYEDWQYYLVDECPSCGRFKDAMYELCLDCANERTFTQWKPTVKIPTRNRQYSIEHSKAWEKGDKKKDRFFVYACKLDSGEFYIGQTRELRERMSEHRDDPKSPIHGRNPKLQYFEILPDRKAAELREVELKKIKDSNPRQLRRMIIGFKDLIRELDVE